MKDLWVNSMQWISNLIKTIGSYVRRGAETTAQWSRKGLAWIKHRVLKFFNAFKERYHELFKSPPASQPSVESPPPGSVGTVAGPPPVESPKAPDLPPLTPASGKGVWIWRLVQAEDGHVQMIIDRAKQAGLSWIAVKGGDGTSHWVQLTGEMVRKIQEAGIKVFGWVYTYGNNPRNEAEVAKEIFRLGCDGLIIDAEKEYEGKPAVAEEYMSIIRAAYPEAFIAYSTFPIISKHPAFPYREFGKHCNVSMPQCYWKMIGETPETMIRRLQVEWSAWEDLMLSTGDRNAVVPIVPVGQAFGVGSQELEQFMKAAEGYGGTSLWSWADMNPELWKTYSD